MCCSALCRHGLHDNAGRDGRGSGTGSVRARQGAVARFDYETLQPETGARARRRTNVGSGSGLCTEQHVPDLDARLAGARLAATPISGARISGAHLIGAFATAP